MNAQKSELWLAGINDEYCWMHTPGGWDCIQCRLEVTLPEFFAAVGKWAEAGHSIDAPEEAMHAFCQDCGKEYETYHPEWLLCPGCTETFLIADREVVE